MQDNSIMPFASDEFGEIRVIEEDGNPWFVAKDVCNALGLSNVSRALASIDPENVKDANITQSNLYTHGRWPKLINEPALYALISKSTKPAAKAFQRWVYGEVLPAIRKRGGYMVVKEDESEFDTVARALLIVKDALDRKTEELERTQSILKSTEIENEVLEKEHGKLLAENTELKPKALFADAVATSKQSILIGELAKVLKGNGVKGMGQNRLFGWMRENGYLMKRGGHKNMPTQKAMELGLFEVKETSVTHSDGHVTISMTPKVTGKGQQYFVNKFLGEEVA